MCRYVAILSFQSHICPMLAEVPWSSLCTAQRTEFDSGPSRHIYGGHIGQTVAIKDSFPKFVVTLDDLAGGIEAGIQHIRIPGFLLDPAW